MPLPRRYARCIAWVGLTMVRRTRSGAVPLTIIHLPFSMNQTEIRQFYLSLELGIRDFRGTKFTVEHSP